MLANDSQKWPEKPLIFVFSIVKIPNRQGWAIANALLSFGKGAFA
jgi:hypothetical protein